MKPRDSRLPLILLSLMTVLLLGGPIGFGYVLRGGTSPNWPPDRPVEWITLAVLLGLTLALMSACLPIYLEAQKAIHAKKTSAEPAKSRAKP